MSAAEVRCECGQATGVRCDWTGKKSETTVVDWMPEYLRDSHRAAGNSGSYPANGSLRLRVQDACADRLSDESDDDEEEQS